MSIKHNPFELLDLSIQPIMFVLLFTYVFGGAISGSPGDYLQFALPGIIVQNAIFATLTTGVGLNTDLTKGVFDRLRSLPIARWSPLAGRIVADTVKQVWAISLLLGVGMMIGLPGARRRGRAARRATRCCWSSRWPSRGSRCWSASSSDNPEKVQIFGFVVIFPLTFTSNAFVPTDTMPGWLQAWVEGEPGDDPGGRGPRAAQRHAPTPVVPVPALGGRHHDRVRPARRRPVQAPHLTHLALI